VVGSLALAALGLTSCGAPSGQDIVAERIQDRIGILSVEIATASSTDPASVAAGSIANVPDLRLSADELIELGRPGEGLFAVMGEGKAVVVSVLAVASFDPGGISSTDLFGVACARVVTTPGSAAVSVEPVPCEGWVIEQQRLQTYKEYEVRGFVLE
jgi:hypothetical protein